MPAVEDAHQLTRLLKRWSAGEEEALDEIVPLLYDELRCLARRRLRGERSGHTLDTTALVHEAYVKLVDVNDSSFRDRSHFLAMASRVMRRILVDHARAKNAAKRGGGAPVVPLDEELAVSDPCIESVLELDDALERLEEVDPRSARAIEQRYFGGLTLKETAEAIGISLATVKRDLRFARAWLARALSADGAEVVS